MIETKTTQEIHELVMKDYTGSPNYERWVSLDDLKREIKKIFDYRWNSEFPSKGYTQDQLILIDWTNKCIATLLQNDLIGSVDEQDKKVKEAKA